MLFIKDKKYLVTLITLLLSIVVLLGFSSCNTGNTSDGTETTDVTTTDASAGDELGPDLDIVKDGVAQVKIIRGENMDSSLIQYAAKVGTAITQITKAQAQVKTDYVKRGSERTEAEEKEPAIIVGVTNYKASEELMATVKTYNSFNIKVVGNQVIIAAHDPTGMAAALSIFEDALEDHYDRKTNSISLPRDYSYEYKSPSVLGNVPILHKGTFEGQSECGDNALMITNKNVSAEDFKEYVEYAVANGLTKYAENQIGSNLFVTLKNDKVILNASYYQADKRIRLIADNPKKTALHPISDQRTGDASPTMTQLGLEYNYDNPSNPYKFTKSDWQIGLAYIFRLSDGSFIVIDGGYNKDRNAQMLYDEMRAQMSSPNEKITIAAWIFTHVHGDHIGAFKKFMDKYKYEINLDYVIYNTGSPAQQKSMGEVTDGMASAANTAIQYIPQSRILIARPGQKMTFRNATLEVYHTSELLPESVTNGNSLCIAFRIVIAGQSFFFTGDCMTDASNAMVRYYGSALKSDFEQINHHGASGPTNELHAAIDPTIVLWPLGEYDYFYDPNNPGKITRSREEYNRYLFESPNVKEIILAGHTTRTLSLPYVFPIVRVDPVQTTPFD